MDAAGKASAESFDDKYILGMGTGAASTTTATATATAARRERLGSSKPLPTGYNHVSGIGLTPGNEQDSSYSTPAMASLGSHLPGNSAVSAPIDPWATARIDPQNLFSTIGSFEFGAGHPIADLSVYRSPTVEDADDTPELSKDSELSLPYTDDSESVCIDSREIFFGMQEFPVGDLHMDMYGATGGALEVVDIDATQLDQTTCYDKPFGRDSSLCSLENHTSVQYPHAGTGRDAHDNAKDPGQLERSISQAKALSATVPVRPNVPQTAIDTEKSPINQEGSPESSSTSTTLTASEVSSFEDEGHPISMVNKKEVLLDRLMGYFYSILSSPGIYNRSCADGSTNNTPRRQNGGTLQELTHRSSLGITSPSQNPSRKRKVEGEDEDEEDQGHKRPRPEPQSQPDAVDEERQRLACPFFKKEPEKYRQRRSCSGPGWYTVHRVKEHVYRSHALPIACPICHETFENDRLKDDHLKRPERCEFREQLPIEGMDTTQKEQLRTRKQSHKYMTEAEKWNDMYLILFPRADPISLPSPYYEYTSAGAKGTDSEFTRYEQFLRRELPVHVRRELEIRIDERLNPLEENLRSELVGIVRDMQLRLLDMYKAMRTASSTAAAATAEGETSTGGASSQVQQIDSTEVRASVENELQPFEPPPYFENFEDFNTFNGIFFDFSDMQYGSVEPDSGYGSFPSEKGSGTCALDDRGGDDVGQDVN